MKTGAVLFAPAHYEAMLTFRIKGLPFFLFAAAKLAGIIGKENVVVISGSSNILDVSRQFGFNATPLPKEDKASPKIPHDIKQFFTEQKDCYISVFAGMPHFSEATVEEGLKKITDNYAFVFTTSIVVGGGESNSFSERFSEKEIRLPFSFICAKNDALCSPENTAKILVDPRESQVYTSPGQLTRFASSEDCVSFFSGLSPDMLQLLHPHPIKMLLLDIDGVLTDGGMYYSEAGDEFKKFDTKDGLAIKMLTKRGFRVGFISAGKNKNLIESRAKLLGVQHCYVGFEPKLGILDQWLKELAFSYEHVLYVGDDLVDLDIFNAGVLSACPADAVKAIKEKAKIILGAKGGKGCVRELVDNYMTYLTT